MTQGKWYLSCTQFDSMENRNPEHEHIVALQATDEASALAEAKTLWEEKIAKKYQGWNGEVYPKNPRLYYYYQAPFPAA